MGQKVDIQKLFAGLQLQMTAQLSANREFISHPGSKGDALENTWIEWLHKYLPNRYSVDKAIIIDCEGNTSDQIDVVIYDNWYTPFIFNQNGFKYIPTEGVYAVFEVKPDIKGKCGKENYLQYAGKKIKSVRELKRTSTQMINSGVKLPARPITKIIGGFLCSTNSYTHQHDDTIKSQLKTIMGLSGIDIGCIADYGSFYVDYDIDEDVNEKDFPKRIMDYYEKRKANDVIFSSPDNSLVTFFLQLTRFLQQAIGTVSAIDLQAYLNGIGETIDDKP